MDREAWCAVIHGVVKSRTWLSNWTELNWTRKKKKKKIIHFPTKSIFHICLYLLYLPFCPWDDLSPFLAKTNLPTYRIHPLNYSKILLLKISYLLSLSYIIKQNKVILGKKLCLHPHWPPCNPMTVLSILIMLLLSCHIWEEKAMSPHSSTLSWKIPWMEESGRL